MEGGEELTPKFPFPVRLSSKEVSMRYVSLLLALAMSTMFGSVQACPDSSSNQTKSTTIDKPLAPKPSA